MSLTNNLARDAVHALHLLDPIVVHPADTVGVAIERMCAGSSGCVVVTEHRKPIGMFTDRDIVMKVLAKRLSLDTPVAQVMTPEPHVLREGCSVASVIRAMHEGGFRHMPVVDASGFLNGVVSVKRIVEYVVDHFPSTVFNLPPDPEHRPTAREGA
ncbi:MAG: CBS domain-containing protein [Phycisphaerae bacterium]